VIQEMIFKRDKIDMYERKYRKYTAGIKPGKFAARNSPVFFCKRGNAKNAAPPYCKSRRGGVLEK
jgi:hypothetical protein